MADVELPDPGEVTALAEDPFARRVALVVAVYAVGLAVAAAGGSNAGKDMIMAQQEASNLWAYYQAKVIREALYQNQADELDADLDRPDLPPSAADKLRKSLARVRGKLAEYKAEKAEIMAKARAAEADRDVARRKDPYFDFAEVLLQIAIVLASVAMLARRRWAFRLSLAVAALGVALTANGFGLFVRVPGLDDTPPAATAGA